jgi:hypothetical protein
MLSVTDPIQRSMDWTRKLLFQPFNFGKWCAMGLTAFLANLLAGGGGANMATRRPFGASSHKGFDHLAESCEEACTWLQAHLTLVLVLLAFVAVVVLVVKWLGARGQFMFLDNVVNDRDQVVEPWSKFRIQGNRVFLFAIMLALVSCVVLAAGGYVGWRIAGPDLADMHFGVHAMKGILAALGLTVPLMFVLFVISLLLRDFVVPVMYLRGTPVLASFGILWREVMPGHGGSFVLFYLMKLVLTIAAGIVMLFGTCLTCCIAGLPLVSSVVFLPVFVFFRSYSLHFLGQCGEEWRMLP